MKKTRRIVLIGAYLALFVVLDYLSSALVIFKMPSGGSLGLGTIALLLASYQLGVKDGLIVSLVSVPLQFITGRVYFLSFGQFFMEYVVAFGIYGISSLFKNYKYFYPGVFVSSAVRFVMHWLAGVWFWETTYWASLIYQVSYMLPTIIMGIILIPLLDSHLNRNK